MFRRDYKVERFNVDKKNKLGISTLFHYLNDIMERNAESYGMGASYHLRHNLAWVLVEYQLDIEDLPHSDSIINVGTLPYSFKRIYGYRIYEGKSPSGTHYFKGKGKFALINIKTKAFVRPTDDMLERFTDAKKDPVAIPFEKWRIQTDSSVNTYQRQVPHSHIDVNNHLNNAYYPAYAYEALSDDVLQDHTITKVYVKFKREVFAEAMLTIKVYQYENTLYVSINNENEVACEVAFELKKEKR